ISYTYTSNHQELRADRSRGTRHHQQDASGIAREGKTLCERLGVLALAGLFHVGQLEVYTALATEIFAAAQMDKRCRNLCCDRSAARFSRFSTRARVRYVRRSNRAGERIAATSSRSAAHSRRKGARHSR